MCSPAPEEYAGETAVEPEPAALVAHRAHAVLRLLPTLK